MSLIEAWDRQQELYIGGREARFDDRVVMAVEPEHGPT